MTETCQILPSYCPKLITQWPINNLSSSILSPTHLWSHIIMFLQHAPYIDTWTVLITSPKFSTSDDHTKAILGQIPIPLIWHTIIGCPCISLACGMKQKNKKLVCSHLCLIFDSLVVNHREYDHGDPVSISSHLCDFQQDGGGRFTKITTKEGIQVKRHHPKFTHTLKITHNRRPFALYPLLTHISVSQWIQVLKGKNMSWVINDWITALLIPKVIDNSVSRGFYHCQP